MATLYEISENIRKVMEDGFSVDEDTGEILFDETDLEQLNVNLNEKMESVMLMIKNLAADEESIKAEKMAFAKRQEQKKRKREWLEGYLALCMKRNGMSAFETAKGVAKLSNRKSVIITDETEIPSEFMKVQKYVPDKTAIKNAIAAGVHIPGATYDVPDGKISIK